MEKRAGLGAGTRGRGAGMEAACRGGGRPAPEKRRTAQAAWDPKTPIPLSTRERLRMTILVLLIAKQSFKKRFSDVQTIYLRGQEFMEYLLKGFLNKLLKFYKRH